MVSDSVWFHASSFNFTGLYQKFLGAFEGNCPHPGRFQCNGMRSLAIAPRTLIGPPAAFRVIFTHPLFRHLCVEIILFLADETSGFTADTQHFAQTSSFLLRLTLTFRRVDTPSVGSPVSPVIFIEDDSDGQFRLDFRSMRRCLQCGRVASDSSDAQSIAIAFKFVQSCISPDPCPVSGCRPFVSIQPSFKTSIA